MFIFCGYSALGRQWSVGFFYIFYIIPVIICKTAEFSRSCPMVVTYFCLASQTNAGPIFINFTFVYWICLNLVVNILANTHAMKWILPTHRLKVWLNHGGYPFQINSHKGLGSSGEIIHFGNTKSLTVDFSPVWSWMGSGLMRAKGEKEHLH